MQVNWRLYSEIQLSVDFTFTDIITTSDKEGRALSIFHVSSVEAAYTLGGLPSSSS